MVVLTFDLHHSDLPLQIAFPILMVNLTRWLAPTSAVDVPAQLSPGMPVIVRPQVGVGDGDRAGEIAVVAPSGQRWSYTVEGSEPIPFAHTEELGVYVVEQRGEDTFHQAHFAVNLFSDLESRIEPQDAISVGQSTLSSQATGAVGRREWWRWPALLALIVLLIEWAVHWRGRTGWIPSLGGILRRGRKQARDSQG